MTTASAVEVDWMSLQRRLKLLQSRPMHLQ
jgi:hypothetical protein